MAKKKPLKPKPAALQPQRAIIVYGPGEGPRIRHLESALRERRRQLALEGWTPSHDDQYVKGELAEAAACYALASMGEGGRWAGKLRWPWHIKSWKGGVHGPRRCLEIAMALLLAEMERRDRSLASAIDKILFQKATENKSARSKSNITARSTAKQMLEQMILAQPIPREVREVSVSGKAWQLSASTKSRSPGLFTAAGKNKPVKLPAKKTGKKPARQSAKRPAKKRGATSKR